MDRTSIGSYQVTRRLEEDGEVYLCTSSEGRVCLVRLASATADAEAIEQARRETGICAAMGEEAILPVYELVEVDGRLAVVSEEPPDGASLAQLVDRIGQLEKKLPPEAVWVIGRRIAKLLALSHSATDEDDDFVTICHGHLSGGVIHLGWDGSLRLEGLGLAAVAAAGLRPAEGFTAPEERSGPRVTPRGDSYGLAALVWSLLANEPPKDNMTVEALGDQVPASLRDPLARALEPKLGKRKITAMELEQWFGEHANAEGQAALDDLCSLLKKGSTLIGTGVRAAGPEPRPRRPSRSSRRAISKPPPATVPSAGVDSTPPQSPTPPRVSSPKPPAAKPTAEEPSPATERAGSQRGPLKPAAGGGGALRGRSSSNPPGSKKKLPPLRSKQRTLLGSGLDSSMLVPKKAAQVDDLSWEDDGDAAKAVSPEPAAVAKAPPPKPSRPRSPLADKAAPAADAPGARKAPLTPPRLRPMAPTVPEPHAQRAKEASAEPSAGSELPAQRPPVESLSALAPLSADDAAFESEPGEAEAQPLAALELDIDVGEVALDEGELAALAEADIDQVEAGISADAAKRMSEPGVAITLAMDEDDVEPPAMTEPMPAAGLDRTVPAAPADGAPPTLATPAGERASSAVAPKVEKAPTSSASSPWKDRGRASPPPAEERKPISWVTALLLTLVSAAIVVVGGVLYLRHAAAVRTPELSPTAATAAPSAPVKPLRSAPTARLRPTATVGPPATATTATTAPAAPDGRDGSDLQATQGYLVVKFAGARDADVHVFGKAVGKVGTKVEVPCTRPLFVRIGQGPGKWLSQGGPVQVKCQSVTEHTVEPSP